MISVDEKTYDSLKKLGCAGDSFNDVISGILKQKVSQASQKVVHPEEAAIVETEMTRCERSDS